MSVLVMSLVFRHSQARGNDRLILLAIADRADDDGENCWKATKTLAEAANVSKRTAQRSIDALVELGELEVVERPGTTHLIRVRVENLRGDNLTPRQPVTRDTRDRGGATPVSPDTSIHPSTPQPPASGGRILRPHCERHRRWTRDCRACSVAAAPPPVLRPPWCGHCHEPTRQLEGPDGLPIGRCPDCHPLTASPKDTAHA